MKTLFKPIIVFLLLILFGTFSQAQWYTSDYDYSRQITLTGVDSQDLIRVDLNSETGIGNIFSGSTFDANTVAFVDCSTGLIQLYHNRIYSSIGNAVGFDVNVGTSNTCIEMRYGSSTTTVNQSLPHQTYDIYDDFEDGNFMMGEATWVAGSGTWSITNGVLTETGGTGTLYTDLNAARSYGNGLLSFITFNACVSCASGVSNESNPFSASADGYQLFRSVSESNLRLEEIENGNNVISNAGSHTYVFPELFRWVRNDSGFFQAYDSNSYTQITSLSNATYTSGQYFYLRNGSSIQVDSVAYSYHYDKDSSLSFGSEQATNSNLLTFRVVDEDTNVSLQANVLINDTNTVVESNGLFDVNLLVHSFPITIDVSQTNYDNRSFYFQDVNALSENTVLGLRAEDESKDIVFQFFAPDQTTKLTNRTIKVLRGNILSGRQATNSDAKITFNLAPQDNQYDFKIFSSGTTFGDQNIEYSYESATVTINNPKLEKDPTTNAPSPGGFDFDVGGLGLQSITGQTSFPFSTIYILTNTQDSYSLRVVDNNSTAQQYFARFYSMQAKGSTSSLTITPYLLSLDDGVLTNIKIIDLPTSISVPGVLVTLKKGLNGSLSTVEAKTTDSTGIAQVVMLSQSTYDLSVDSQNLDTNYFSGEISATNTEFEIFINFSGEVFSFIPKYSTVSYSPIGTNLVSSASQSIDININTSFDINRILIQILDGNTVVDSNSSTTKPFNQSFTVNTNNFDTNSLQIKTTITSQDYNSTFYKTYLIGGKNLEVGFQNLGEFFTAPTLAFLFFIILLGTLLVLGPGLFGNSEALLFPAAILTGIFFFIWLTELSIIFMAAAFVGGVAWMWVRSRV